jgi:hypothetical protein
VTSRKTGECEPSEWCKTGLREPMRVMSELPDRCDWNLANHGTHDYVEGDSALRPSRVGWRSRLFYHKVVSNDTKLGIAAQYSKVKRTGFRWMEFIVQPPLANQVIDSFHLPNSLEF